MNRYLNLDKLDIPGRHGGRVTAELFARLRAQKIMEKYKPASNVFHIKIKISMDYRPALFQNAHKAGSVGWGKGNSTNLGETREN